MANKRQSDAFDRVAADPGRQWREDGCAAVVPWERVAGPNRVNYLANYAASYDVSFERFERAVQNALSGQAVGAAEQRTWRDKFDAARLLLAPVDPLDARFEKILDCKPYRAATPQEQHKRKGIER